MLKRYGTMWSRVFMLCDWLLVVASINITTFLATGTLGLPQNDALLHGFVSYALLLLLWAFFTRIFNLYASKRFLSFHEDAKAVLATTVSTVTVYTTIGLFAGLFVSIVFPQALLVAFLAVTIFHYGVRIFLRALRASGHNQRKVLIYGSGQLGQLVAIAIERRPWTGLKIIGFIDDDPTTHNTHVCAYPVLGPPAHGRALIEEGSVDELIITLPANAFSDVMNFILEIQRFPVHVRVVPDLLQVVTVQARIEDLWGIPVIGIRQPMIDGFDALLKRTLDLLGAGVGLLLAGPIMAVIAVLIKLDAPGPVLFVQERVGQNGKPFRMMKFRTMVTDAEQQLTKLVDFDKLEQPMFKIKNDPRVTRVGVFLRKTSLDELPQLLNVLRGEMSLVGPRPEEKRLVDRYSYWHRQRLAVKPGVTGPMQVGGRGDLSLDDRVSVEVDYIENYSLLLDIEIMLRTIPAVLFGRGAY